MSKFTMPNIKVPVFENCTKPFVNVSVVSVREISKILSFMQEAQRVKPKFLNKAPLHPVKSSGVMHQVQVDLVDMKSYPAHFESQPFKYILVLLDVFSRFMFLWALKSKSTDEVPMCLLKIFVTPDHQQDCRVTKEPNLKELLNG